MFVLVSRQCCQKKDFASFRTWRRKNHIYKYTVTNVSFPPRSISHGTQSNHMCVCCLLCTSNHQVRGEIRKSDPYVMCSLHGRFLYFFKAKASRRNGIGLPTAWLIIVYTDSHWNRHNARLLLRAGCMPQLAGAPPYETCWCVLQFLVSYLLSRSLFNNAVQTKQIV